MEALKTGFSPFRVNTHFANGTYNEEVHYCCHFGWNLLELRPLVAVAIRIAREHSDEYLRHRVEVQLGAGEPYKPLPNHLTEQDEKIK